MNYSLEYRPLIWLLNHYPFETEIAERLEILNHPVGHEDINSWIPGTNFGKMAEEERIIARIEQDPVIKKYKSQKQLILRALNRCSLNERNFIVRVFISQDLTIAEASKLYLRSSTEFAVKSLLPDFFNALEQDIYEHLFFEEENGFQAHRSRYFPNRQMFGEEVRRQRLLNKYTQQRLAYQLDVDVRSIRKWERGFSLPRKETLDKLKELLHMA